MKKILRRFLISLGALWITSQTFPALAIKGGIEGFVISALAFMAVDLILVPLLKVLFLPLNLLTLGVFSWLSNVVALYFLVSALPFLKILPYYFAGADLGVLILPATELTAFYSVLVASFLIGSIIHLMNWLSK